MQRTIENATQYLDQTANVTPRQVHDGYVAEVERARAAAREMAIRFMDVRTTELADTADAVERGLRSVRSEHRRLHEAADAGRVSAADFNKQFALLCHQQRALERRVGEVERAAEHVHGIEVDPVLWADETFFGKYPHLRPDFSF
jgi:hypothetical protein